MPYVYCESCAGGFYSNVLSCPSCGAPVRRTEGREETRRRARRIRSLRVSEDVEAEVRDALYSWHSGAVERISSDS